MQHKQDLKYSFRCHNLGFTINFLSMRGPQNSNALKFEYFTMMNILKVVLFNSLIYSTKLSLELCPIFMITKFLKRIFNTLLINFKDLCNGCVIVDVDNFLYLLLRIKQRILPLTISSI